MIALSGGFFQFYVFNYIYLRIPTSTYIYIFLFLRSNCVFPPPPPPQLQRADRQTLCPSPTGLNPSWSRRVCGGILHVRPCRPCTRPYAPRRTEAIFAVRTETKGLKVNCAPLPQSFHAPARAVCTSPSPLLAQLLLVLILFLLHFLLLLLFLVYSYTSPVPQLQQTHLFRGNIYIYICVR